MQNIILKDNKSDYHDLIEYPDGQKNVCLKLDKLNNKEPVLIRCRLRNFSELEVFFCLINALKDNDFYIEGIDYVYLFGIDRIVVLTKGKLIILEM